MWFARACRFPQQIRVGPESAGSEPGPACYGRGGEGAAVTDADLILGKLDPGHFAGGSITLHPDQSAAALDRVIGGPLGMDATESAFGLSEVVDENMANAARVHAVENGEDLSDYTMIALWRSPACRTALRRRSSAVWCRRVQESGRPSVFCAHLSVLNQTVQSSCDCPL